MSRRRSNSISPAPLSFTPTLTSPTRQANGNGTLSKRQKNITRDVMKSFEGINVEVVEIPEGEEEEGVRRAVNSLNGNGHGHANGLNGTAKENGIANGVGKGNGNGVEGEVKKIDWEIPRKLLHSSIGFLTLYLYTSNGSVSNVVFVLWSSLCIIVPADILRFNSQRFERTYERVLGFLMRESEKHSVNGVIWYILGVNFALAFYPNDIATVAILILSWADTAASTIGRLFAHTSPKLPARLPLLPFSLPTPFSFLNLHLPLAPRKSLAGFLAASATGFLIAVTFWSKFAPVREGVSYSLEGGIWGTGVLSGWVGLGVVGLVSGLVSGVAEALDLGKADDNLTLPIISGGCILGFFKALQWLWS